MNVRDRLTTDHVKGEIAFTIESRSKERVIARMPVTDGILNPFGTVHAGAMIWFADVTATVCAIGDPANVGEDGQGFPLAVDLHTVLAGNQRDGELVAIAHPVRRGKNLIVIRTEVTGHDGRLLISMTTTHVPAR